MVAALKKQIVLMNKKLQLAEKKMDKPGSKNPAMNRSLKKSENKSVAKSKSQVKPVARKNKSRGKSALEESRDKPVDGKKKQITGGNKSLKVKPVLKKSQVKTLSKKVKNAESKNYEDSVKTIGHLGPLPVDQKTKKGKKELLASTKNCRNRSKAADA